MWEQATNQMPGMPIRLPREWTLHQPPRVVEKGVKCLVTLLAIRADELRLVVKGIDVTHTATCEYLDDPLHLWLKCKGRFLSVSACILG